MIGCPRPCIACGWGFLVDGEHVPEEKRYGLPECIPVEHPANALAAGALAREGYAVRRAEPRFVPAFDTTDAPLDIPITVDEEAAAQCRSEGVARDADDLPPTLRTGRT